MRAVGAVAAACLAQSVAAGSIDAVVATDYEIGYCSSLNPSAAPPNPPGYWCSSFNRGYNEKACWTATQNCCYINMNLTDPGYPGTGQCVHEDPCKAAGGKVCGAKCHPLRTAAGIMTCVRPKGGEPTPMYTPKYCVGKAGTTGQQYTDFIQWVCNPANSKVNCDMLNGGGSSAYPTPGILPAGAATDEGTYTSGSWALHQFYVLTGQCNSLGELVDPPGPVPPPPPPPTPAPPAPPTPPADTLLLGVSDCNVPAFNAQARCAKAVREWGAARFALAHVPIGWADPSKLGDVFAEVEGVWAAGMVPVLSWMPYPYKTWTRPSPNADIAAGQYDDYIDAFASRLKTFVNGTRRAYVRFAPQANGNFFPWSPTCPPCGSTGQNISQSAASFVALWRYVKAKVDAHAVPNVRWVWAANNVDPADGSAPAAAVFPGAEEVDWVAVDGLNFGDTLPGHSWQTPDEVLAAQLKVVTGLAPAAPVGVTLLGTTSSPNGVAAKGAWLAGAMEYFRSAAGGAGRVGMVLLLNQDTSADFAFLGGTKGDGEVAVAGQQVQSFSALRAYVRAATCFVATNATLPGLLTPEQFATGKSA